MNRTTLIYGLGAIGLGVLGLVYLDFALQWEPVPKDLPFHDAVAGVSSGLTLLAGVAAIWRRSTGAGLVLLAVIYATWALLLHGPKVAAAPGTVAEWNGLAEPLALSLAAIAGLAQERAPRLQRIAQGVFGACALVFGAAHFTYADFTASMVPGWLPAPLAWAYITGAGQAAAGLALVSGVIPRLAATLQTAMYATFVLILHIPRVAAAPTNRLEWTMLFVAVSLTGAAWIVRSSIPPRGAPYLATASS